MAAAAALPVSGIRLVSPRCLAFSFSIRTLRLGFLAVGLLSALNLRRCASASFLSALVICCLCSVACGLLGL